MRTAGLGLIAAFLLAVAPLGLDGHASKTATDPGGGAGIEAAPGSFAALARLIRSDARVLRQQAEVAGTVVDGSSLRPVAGAQVVAAGTQIGGLSDGRGRFRLTGLTGETVTLRVVRLGYKDVEQVVQMGDLGVRVVLQSTAIVLDQIIVTGTPGETRTRTIGNAVGKLDAAEITEVAPASNVQDVLSGRIPGVAVLTGQGNLGTGGVTQVRGLATVSLTNEPLIFVDGVRVNNDPRAGPSIRGGRQVSRINDFSPEDIESIEVIKGPAAATLYGTEASNGVIQIITKRGNRGEAQFDLTVRQGANWLSDPGGRLPTNYWTDPATGQIVSLNLFEQEEALGDPMFRTGMVQGYTASLSGGNQSFRYYLSGQYDDEQGIVSYNWRKRYSTRINLTATVSDRLDVTSNIGFVRNHMRLGQAANGWDLMGQIHWGSPSRASGSTRGFLRATPQAVATIESYAEIDRFTWSTNVNHRPFDWLTHRLNVGADVGDETNSILFPRHPTGDAFFFGGASLGDKSLERRRSTFATFDWAATANFDLTEGISTATSAGFQYYSRRFELNSARGRVFPAPSVTTIDGAATTFGGEDILENKTVGLYVQEQVSINDRVFLTAAVRGDDNSAFGVNYNFVTYPKFSATWIVNEESFWNVGWLNALKLRSAWGQAGQQPDVFAAARLYQPATGPGDASVLTPENIGNPDLRPEKGQELEIGFDAGLLEDRIGVAFTYYDQRTKDAIVQRQVSPSSGFPGSQFVNIGEIRNKGIELGLTSVLVQQGGLSWDLGMTLSTNTNEVVSLGDLSTLSAGGLQQHKEGYPVAGYHFKNVVSATLDGSGNVTESLCESESGSPVPCASAPRVFMGRPNPAWQGNVNTTLNLFGSLRLFANVEFKGGHHLISGDIGAAHVLLRNSQAVHERTDPILMALASARMWRESGYMDASFAKLREVSASYTLPDDLVTHIGASRTTLTLAGRNLLTVWQATKDIFGREVLDPENRLTSSELTGYFQTVLPQYASFVATVRVQF